MRRIQSFDPSIATTTQTIEVGAADVGSKILLYNLSPRNLDLDFFNGNDSVLHAWEARYWTLDGETREIGWTLDSIINVTNAPPISLVMGELYNPQEMVEGTFPISLMHQTSVGNPVSTNVASSNQLLNTGNPSGTNVVTVNSTSNAGSTVLLTNDGLLQLLVTIAGALVQVLRTYEPSAGGTILQLGAATYLAEVLGSLQVDTQLSVNGTGNNFHNGANYFGGTTTGSATAEIAANGSVQFDNGTIVSNGSGFLTVEGGLKLGSGASDFIESGDNSTKVMDMTSGTDIFFNPPNSGTGHFINFATNNTNRFRVGDSGPGLQNGGAMFLLTGSVARMTGSVSTTCGAGTTITHGLGATPNYVSFVTNIAQAGSATNGVGNIGSTTFQGTVGSGSACTWSTKL